MSNPLDQLTPEALAAYKKIMSLAESDPNYDSYSPEDEEKV